MSLIDDLTDLAVGLFAYPIADFKSQGLQTRRELDLAADPELLRTERRQSRDSMAGKECNNEPVDMIITRCSPNQKAARRKERIEFTEAGIHGCPDHAETAARLRRDMDEVEHARLAKHVYLKYDKDTPEDLMAPPPGFLDVSPEELAELGLDESVLSPNNSNFRAAVYKKDPAVWGENALPKFDLVFRGSTTAKEDWENNMAQNSNLQSSYYEQAVGIGNLINKTKATDLVHVVGHSLGGGLAMAAQGGSGATATTFNSASLNPRTVARYSTLTDRQQADSHRILAYQVEGEVLSATQETGLTSLLTRPALGQRVIVPPSSQALSDGDRHGIDETIKAIEAQKSADEAAIKLCLGTQSS